MRRLFTFFFMLFQVSSAWSLAGTIQNIIGTGKIHKQTGQIYPAIRNNQLYEGDTVIVDSASNLQIRMIDGAVVWLRSNTEFKIDTYKSKKNGFQITEVPIQFADRTKGTSKMSLNIFHEAFLGVLKMRFSKK